MSESNVPPLSLSELARLDEAATKGPWESRVTEHGPRAIRGPSTFDNIGDIRSPADAALIAYLRTHLPEIRERLALPVMATCRDCAHRYEGECGHSETPPMVLSPASRYLPAITEPQKIERDGAPPPFCPLRRRAGGE